MPCKRNQGLQGRSCNASSWSVDCCSVDCFVGRSVSGKKFVSNPPHTRFGLETENLKKPSSRAGPIEKGPHIHPAQPPTPNEEEIPSQHPPASQETRTPTRLAPPTPANSSFGHKNSSLCNFAPLFDYYQPQQQSINQSINHHERLRLRTARPRIQSRSIE